MGTGDGERACFQMVPIWEPRFLYSSHSGVACHSFSRCVASSFLRALDAAWGTRRTPPPPLPQAASGGTPPPLRASPSPSLPGGFRLRNGRRFFQRGVDQLLELGQINRPADRMAVDEEERRTVHAQAVAFLAIGLYLGLEPVTVQISGEPRHIQTQLLRLGDEIITAQLVLAGKQSVVHLPELALIPSGQRGLVGQRRFLVHRQRVVLEGEPDLGRVG